LSAALEKQEQQFEQPTPKSEKGSIFAFNLAEEVLNCKCPCCERHVQFAKKIMEARI